MARRDRLAMKSEPVKARFNRQPLSSPRWIAGGFFMALAGVAAKCGARSD
jgi:hypothetical protein